MKKKRKIEFDFATILHLAELYQEQYLEMGLCLSPEQNDASFHDFVAQYYSALVWETGETPKLNPNAPLFYSEVTVPYHDSW